MNQYLHPVSLIPLEGMRLGPGAMIRETDLYDSTDGSWRPAPCAGATLQEGCTTVWVRPEAKLSTEGRQLLSHLVHNPTYGLTQRSGMWIVVPSAKAKYDGRMQWEVRHPECVQELIDFGLVAPTPVILSLEQLPLDFAWPQAGDVICYLTEAGREEGRRS